MSDFRPDAAEAAETAGFEHVSPVLGQTRSRPVQSLKKTAAEILRFLPVGGGAAATSFVIYATLVAIGLHTAPAKAVGFTTGAIFSFFGNRSFTFRREASGGRKIIVFILLYMITLIFNVSINELGLYLMGSRSLLNLVIAWTVATGCSSIANFIGMKFLVFRGAYRGA